MGKWDLLPQKEDGKENNYAGDFRAPEMPGLQSMHILFVREHNRLADLVKKTLQNSGHGEFESKFLQPQRPSPSKLKSWFVVKI